MAEPFWVQLAKAVESWVTALALVAGGAWAYYQFVLRREKETAVGIDVSFSSLPYGDTNYLVFFDVTLTNKSKVRVTAKADRRPAYEDAREVLAYSGDLLLRKVPPDLSPGVQVGWFLEPPGALKNPLPGDVEADLLSEYELDGKTDFWMEPGESYHVGAAIVLAPGTYLGMVTFIGSAGGHEIWRRSFVVEIPCSPQKR
jgi:hypothetical protein